MPAHWIRPNEMSRAPNRWLWLDSESQSSEGDGCTVESWRLAVTCADWLNEKRRTWQGGIMLRHTTPESLWEYVDDFSRAGQRVICTAHNMGFDVRITQAIPQLRQLGWRLTRWQVSDQGCVLRWRREDRSLWLCDSTSWLPKKLGEIGSMVDLEKRPLPAPDDDIAYWWHRCETDVQILRAAMLPLIKWVRDADLGNWQPTSGSMAWANWRHRHYTHTVLVHDDDDAHLAERAAGYTGRCEAWLHGRLPVQPWSEIDLPLAYPRVCLDTPLPTILRGRVLAPKLATVLGGGDRNRYLVHAKISTRTETLPCRRDGKILWPIGKFDGWYWDRELQLAVDHGAQVEPVTAYRYSAAYALADWAQWVIDVVESTGTQYNDVQRLAVKTWARALIGRFGVRYWAWEDWGEDDVEGVQMDWLVNSETLDVGRILHVAGRQFGADTMVEGANAVPAIMSAVMSECRIRLWRLMEMAGFEHVAYCDTDSVIVDPDGYDSLIRHALAGETWQARVKSSWDHIQVIAPRQLILDEHHRVAGVSRGAQRVSPVEWVGERWEGLTEAAEHGRQDQVVIRPTTWKLTGADSRRRHLDDRQTAPFQVLPYQDPATAG